MSIVDNHGLEKTAFDPLMNELKNDDNMTLVDHPKVPFDDDDEQKKLDEEMKQHQKLMETYGYKLPRYYILKSERHPGLAHIDEQVWYRYAEQVDSSKGFDIIDFPGVCQDTRIVPMNLQTNPEAISRAKAIADSAINIYNGYNYTSFVLVSVDKANCNAELCSFVDSDKYIVRYKPIRGCICSWGPKKCFCHLLMSPDRFFITFTAKEENSHVVKVFQAKAVREVDEDRDYVIFCREKVVTSSQNPPSQDEKKVAEARKQLHQNFLEKIEKSGLSLLDQPLYPDLEVKNVDIPCASAIQDLEKLYSLLP